MNNWKLLKHERMRWGYMTVRQLMTRLSRITKEEKLECFLLLASEARDQRLFDAAVMRAADLSYDIDVEIIKDRAIPKSLNKKIKQTPKYVTPEPIKPIREKPEQKYFNMFNADELERAIEF